MSDLTRPIIGIENRTTQEVFDIMCDRFRQAADALDAKDKQIEGLEAEAKRADHRLELASRVGIEVSEKLTAAESTITSLREEVERLRTAQMDFNHADFYWRTMDPDDYGDNPSEALNRGMIGNYTVCEVASSFTGPVRYGFTAPVLDPETDDEEFLHFETKAEAMTAAGERLAAVEKMRAALETQEQT